MVLLPHIAGTQCVMTIPWLHSMTTPRAVVELTQASLFEARTKRLWHKMPMPSYRHHQTKLLTIDLVCTFLLCQTVNNRYIKYYSRFADQSSYCLLYSLFFTKEPHHFNEFLRGNTQCTCHATLCIRACASHARAGGEKVFSSSSIQQCMYTKCKPVLNLSW